MTQGDGPTVRSILRIVVTVVVSVLALYVVYLLRTPLSWLVIAIFVAVAAAGPVNLLSRRVPRGMAIAIVYFGIVLAPVAVGAALIPPAVEQGVKLAKNLPDYVNDLNKDIKKNKRLNELNRKYHLTTKLSDAADNLISNLGNAPSRLASIGAGIVASIFELVTILVMSIFMVSRGRAWRDAALAYRPPHQAERLRRATDRIATAVASYVGGALAQATIAGITAFLMLVILGVPSPLPLAVIIFLLDLIPLVGATLGAVIVGIVTLFGNFPTDTIIWAIFAIVYQQVENYVIQPRIQSRAVQLDPFIVVVAAIFGGTLMGIVGALLAIPSAAAIQIAVREYLDYRRTYNQAPAEPG
jgi:predicted PurR-regulated permease PerM